MNATGGDHIQSSNFNNGAWEGYQTTLDFGNPNVGCTVNNQYGVSTEGLEYLSVADTGTIQVGWRQTSLGWTNNQYPQQFVGYVNASGSPVLQTYGQISSGLAFSYNLQYDSNNGSPCMLAQVYYALNGQWGWHTMTCIPLSYLGWNGSNWQATELGSHGYCEFYDDVMGGSGLSHAVRLQSNESQNLSGTWSKVSFPQAPSASPSPIYYAPWVKSGDTNDIENYTS